MSEWKKVKLGEICEITAGGDKPPIFSSYKTKECTIPIYSNGIDNEGLYGFTNKAKNRGKAITITGRGANVGTVFYRKEPFMPIIRLLTLNPNSNLIDARYLYYLLKGKKFLSTGSAQPQITVPNIEQYEIEYNPDIPTQLRISTILSRYDSLIENYQKQIKLLEEAAQRLYKEWFVDLRFPGHENTKIVDGVPEGWEKKKLGDIFTYIRGKSYTSKELSDDGILMINLKNIQSYGGYNRNAEKRYIGSYKEEQSLKKGDLVMGVTDMTQERRLVGHVALIPDFTEPVTFSMDLIKIVPFKIPKLYLYCSMRFGGISAQISPLANGVNVLHLKPESMMGIEMIVPSNRFIERFCSYASMNIDKILFLQSQIRLLTEARDRLLPKLMNDDFNIL